MLTQTCKHKLANMQTQTCKQQHPNKDIQIEVDQQEQLAVVLNSRATSILLDNFQSEILEEIINYIRSHKNGKNIYIEVSGGITKDTLAQYCIKGINGISMGSLTHNVKSVDISLDIQAIKQNK